MTRDEIIVTLFTQAEHDHARSEMYRTLREALGYGHNYGDVDPDGDVDWTEAARRLLMQERLDSL